MGIPIKDYTMNHTDFERKKPVNIRTQNPFVIRCNVILLKHALRKAENQILEQIGTDIKLDNINTGLGYIRDAKRALIIALQDDCISEKSLFAVADSLSQAHKNVPIDSVLDCWERSLDFIADMPIPYRVVESESPIKKEGSQLEFDNRLVTGDVKYGGDWHRCLEIARACLEKSLWDGESKLHICGDIQAIHRHIFFIHEEPFVAALYSTKPYSNDATVFCYLNIMDIPVNGGAK